MSRIEGKNILLGVAGGIAAYKSCELLRTITKEGGNVNVVMTKGATKFVSALTFQTLSGNRVSTELFDELRESEISHIALADSADIIVVAPATANIIAGIAGGFADNLLTTVIMASQCPVLICPSMNVNMYENPAVQHNLDILKQRGYSVLEPDEGYLACGWEGKGRLPDVSVILHAIESLLAENDLQGEKMIVTAGATREYIDPVRFISNPSTGKMGYALASEGSRRGADVLLISGKSSLAPPPGVRTVNVVSAAEMHKAVIDNIGWSSIVIKAAAVGDYRPSRVSSGKIKKENGKLTINLERTTDILSEISEHNQDVFVVGFAAETENLVENAKKKLIDKKADMIVANDVSMKGAGFEVDTNIVYIVSESGVMEVPIQTKKRLAKLICDEVVKLKHPSDYPSPRPH